MIWVTAYLVVEHDEEAILSADHVIDMGPGAGVHGGEIVAQGTPKQILKNPKSLTGKYLSGKLSIPIPAERRKGQFAGKKRKEIVIIGASGNNLKNVTAKFPAWCHDLYHRRFRVGQIDPDH